MAEFAYNNAKNASTGHIPFELNCGYHPKVLFEKKVDLYLKSRFTDNLAEELKELMKVCYLNLFYAQELQKKIHNKRVKSCSYAPDKKVRLNSKYIKTKKNKKLESKVFGSFQVLYIVEKQAYKLELSINWKIYNVFHMSLLE